MKLLNQSLKWLMMPMIIIFSLWSLFLYFRIHNEIKGSVDEGLENYKRQVISQLLSDSSIIKTSTLDEGVFFFKEISVDEALKYKDRYIDTLIYMQDADDLAAELEPVRKLSTAIQYQDEYYELNIIQPMIEEDDMIKQLSWSILWLFIMLILTMVWGNNYVLQRLWEPFYKLLSHIKNFRLGSSGYELPEIKTNTREFNDLHRSLNVLLKQNSSAYEQQKLFIGNASHELQTPLATVINKLELLIESGDLVDVQAQAIGEVLVIIERLVRMNKSLLMLTKIENLQYVDNKVLSINEIVKRSLEEMSDIIEFKRVSVTYSEAMDISVIMDVSLAEVMIANLLRNSIFHNYVEGDINIQIDQNVLIVCNTGADQPLDSYKVFDRFYKKDTNGGGSGLGLSIVKAICDLYGFTIEYEYNQHSHCFRVTFNR